MPELRAPGPISIGRMARSFSLGMAHYGRVNVMILLWTAIQNYRPSTNETIPKLRAFSSRNVEIGPGARNVESGYQCLSWKKFLMV